MRRVPERWKLQSVGNADGHPTVIQIAQTPEDPFAATEPAEATAPGSQALSADVTINLYGWANPASGENPTWEVARLLGSDKELALSHQTLVPSDPPECGASPRSYLVFGLPHTPLDLVRQRYWRTIVVGGASRGILFGAVARVDFDRDRKRYCRNLGHAQAALQVLLAGVTVVPSATTSK
jgi:hypothetical protein